jgi:hypothetical protein
MKVRGGVLSNEATVDASLPASFLVSMREQGDGGVLRESERPAFSGLFVAQGEPVEFRLSQSARLL